MRNFLFFGAFLLVFCSFLPQAHASSCLEAQQVADRVISPKVKGKLIWARSEKSGSPSPNDWTFLYFDPFASNNGRLVTVHGNSVRKIDEGLLELDQARVASYKETEIIYVSNIKVDSDKALHLVKDAAGLNEINISRVDYILKADPTNNVPSWRMTIFAYIGKKGDETELGTARVSAITGQIFTLNIDQDKLK